MQEVALPITSPEAGTTPPASSLTFFLKPHRLPMMESLWSRYKMDPFPSKVKWLRLLNTVPQGRKVGHGNSEAMQIRTFFHPVLQCSRGRTQQTESAPCALIQASGLDPAAGPNSLVSGFIQAQTGDHRLVKGGNGPLEGQNLSTEDDLSWGFPLT